MRDIANVRLKLMLATRVQLASTHLWAIFAVQPNETLHRKYNYFSAKSNAIVEVDHVIIDQADAAARGALANASRVIGAVNAIFGAADIYRPRAEWIAGATRNHARQIRLATDHLRRWVPIRPLGFARDIFYT